LVPGMKTGHTPLNGNLQSTILKSSWVLKNRLDCQIQPLFWREFLGRGTRTNARANAWEGIEFEEGANPPEWANIESPYK